MYFYCDFFFVSFQNLIQSAFDGYNVCICAYGQTGSGKTYTILGDEQHPGIAPRTFSEIFQLADEISQSYETSVSFYVLELYNDRLIDLLTGSADSSDKLEIRRDRRGTVWVAGWLENSKNLYHKLKLWSFAIKFWFTKYYLLRRKGSSGGG